jgi:hypothetical protein
MGAIITSTSIATINKILFEIQHFFPFDPPPFFKGIPFLLFCFLYEDYPKAVEIKWVKSCILLTEGLYFVA